MSFALKTIGVVAYVAAAVYLESGEKKNVRENDGDRQDVNKLDMEEIEEGVEIEQFVCPITHQMIK